MRLFNMGSLCEMRHLFRKRAPWDRRDEDRKHEETQTDLSQQYRGPLFLNEPSKFDEFAHEASPKSHDLQASSQPAPVEVALFDRVTDWIWTKVATILFGTVALFLRVLLQSAVFIG